MRRARSSASVSHLSNIVFDATPKKQDDVSIGLEFKNLRLKVSEEVELLKGVSGCFLPGEVVAIMGPSGCSKTTLLNVLSGRAGYHYITGKQQWEGEIKVNNFDFNPPSWGGRVGFVEQFDCTYERLTVREAVQFAADLQLQGDAVLKNQLIDEVLLDLDIFNCQHVYCGGSGSVKGISGGQMKRTMIARSLITNPQFLFLDEPTSGLDSFSSLELLKTLNRIAKSKKKTIVTTLHQPSKAMIEYIDRVIFMYKGEFLFQGTPAELARLMKEDLQELEDENVNVLEEFFATIMTTKKLNCGDFQDWKQFHDPYDYSVESMPTDQLPTYVSVPANPLAQIWYLFMRHVKVNLRNYWTLMFNILASAIIRPLFASFFFVNARLEDPQWAFYGVLWITVDMLPKTIFPYVLQMLEDKTMFMKEHTLQMYDVFPFFMARFLWQMIYCLVICLIVLPIYYGIMNLQGDFGTMLLVFWIYTIMMSNAVFAVACLFQDVKIMNTIFDTFIQGGLCICVFVPTKQLQHPALKLGFYCLGIMKWGVNAVLANEFIKFGKVNWATKGLGDMTRILEDFEVIGGTDYVFGDNPDYVPAGIYYMLFYIWLSATIALIILKLTGKVML